MSELWQRMLCWLHGWRRDRDGWLVRARKKTDIDLIELGLSSIGFTEEACIAVRTCEKALLIDATRVEAAHD